MPLPPASPRIYLPICLPTPACDFLARRTQRYEGHVWVEKKQVYLGRLAGYCTDQYPACAGALLQQCVAARCGHCHHQSLLECCTASAVFSHAGAYDIAEQAACGHDVAALRKGRTEDQLNFPASFYAELAPLVQHLPQVSLLPRGSALCPNCFLTASR